MVSISQSSPTSPSAPIPALHEPNSNGPEALPSPASSPHSSSDDEPARGRLQRPKLGSRKSSGTMIISRDSPRVEMHEHEQDYDEGDVRSMSPRRSTEAVEKLSRDARQALIEQARSLQASLLAIVDRVETVKEEHEKLEGGNKFLQSYIGELIQTTKLTSASGPSTKVKSKSRGIR